MNTTEPNNKDKREEWDKELADVIKHGKRYTSAKELFDDLDREELEKEKAIKRLYPQEMLLMSGCPNCGQEINREFVENVIDEITSLAESRGAEKAVRDILAKQFYHSGRIPNETFVVDTKDIKDYAKSHNISLKKEV